MSTTDNHVCVVGAGLAGTLTALLLAKLGIRVSLFEKRADLGPAEEVSSAFGASTSATKRSINLALSHRGMCALREIGALDEIMQHAVRMPCRVIHSVDAPDVKQAYGTANEAIWSVSRQLINSVLLRRASQHPGIKIHFGYSFVNSTAEGRCTFKVEGSDKGEGEEKGEEAKGGAGAGEGVFEEVYDLIIGADGAYSGVRESMLKKGRVNFSRQYIGHGYMELTIPAKVVPADAGAEERLDFALACPEGLHIWPRGEFMLIAIPNPDKSFTATLFAPYKGEGGFDSVDPKNASQVEAYFQRNFPDVVGLMPQLLEEYRTNPVGSLVTIRTNPWNLGRVLLLGDAAHAVVPFYGQGMNAGFQDGLLLYSIIKRHIDSHLANADFTAATATTTGPAPGTCLLTCAAEFAVQRQPAAEALADLCLEHYADMASSTASTYYLLRKRLEATVALLFPKMFVPLYTMVAFTETPYHEAVARAAQQDRVMDRIALAHLVGLGAGLAGLGWWGVSRYLDRSA
ncbi:hypothetical protein B484DRAFT_448050 [Ochromonadaceae sp. CCMP2298]|nr:hypothetical protein B484DRAFT_448050 [Ochromonadaceae sp. CCMP2298]|mmetsp:Transcript_31502/g.69403  ORF Transcript_31502/g.69403 Transcript_31502/m.69403 type:complete len:515 (-) Transcript_31502:198-1742(-)|eukprot:CAMPEP_0173186580 /NCGR_PEP_ID=MMETSP1141-20130122/10223_1 /TAXON_ID=483371 /ORGANISM="non described non described, Strain CCMP2298" /LENGTH=514 /DNA_ID=CAMNT_0014110303 /DNA_START=125 /DNA_END=1669 /DNA_ORIENTATION=-